MALRPRRKPAVSWIGKTSAFRSLRAYVLPPVANRSVELVSSIASKLKFSINDAVLSEGECAPSSSPSPALGLALFCASCEAFGVIKISAPSRASLFNSISRHSSAMVFTETVSSSAVTFPKGLGAAPSKTRTSRATTPKLGKSMI